ncbi:MAG TPA: tetratricopeptide repeat protein [Bryobacteraceae bacterium]|nr:tetratricopeptide repeat protein [Bryobacteraceae bacterium]
MTIARRALGALFILLVFSVSCNRDPEKVKKTYVERGNEYFKNGKYKEAAIMYRSALKKDMRYGEAHYRLGLAELRAGRFVEALRSLRRARELSPENMDAATQLANIYLVIFLKDPKHSPDALKELEQISTPLLEKDPKSFLGLRIKGFVAVAAKDNAGALKAFEAAHAIKPYSEDIILPLVEALAVNGRFPEAEKLAQEMLKREKTLAAMYDWLYFRYVGLNRVADAEKTYIAKVENNPKQSLYILQLAGHYLVTQKRPEMEKTLQRITANSKEFPLGHIQVGDFYLRMRDVDTAVKYYEEGMRVETLPEQKLAYQKRLVETLVMRGRKQEALDLIAQVLKAHPKDFEAVAMRASLWLQDGGKEKVQSAITELNSVIVRNPENFVLRYNLGRAHVAKGDMEQARIQFLEAIKYRPDYTPARLALAQLHLAKNEFTKALQAAEDILNYDPNNITARMIRTSCRMGLGDLPTARQELSMVLAANPNYPDALFQMGVLNFHEKRYKEAEDHFLRLQKIAPNDPRGLVGRVETMAGLKQFDAAIKLLQDDLKQNPERSFYRLALGNVAVRAENYDLAATEYRKLLQKNPKNFDVQIRLAEALRFKGDYSSSIAEFAKARDLNPGDATAYVRLALLYEGTGRRNEAKPLYEQILKLEPDNGLALNNLAYILAENGGDLDQALTMAQKAKAKFPNSADIADTLGWIYIKKNLSDPAIKIFRELVDKDARNPLYRYHLAMALFQKGDKPSAKKECELALKNSPSREDEVKIKELMGRI